MDQTKVQPPKKGNKISIKDKLLLIKLREENVSYSVLAAKFGISLSYVAKILKEKDNIIEHSTYKTTYHRSIPPRPKFDYNLIKNAVFLWYCQQKKLKNAITPEILRNKAVEFNTKFKGPPDFTGCLDWLNEFRTSYEIKILDPKDECPVTNVYTPESLLTYDLDNVYSADETILTWKSLPNKVIEYLKKNDKNYNDQLDDLLEEHVTLMISSNATGSHKLPLFLVTDNENVKYFNEIINVAVLCRSNNEAWMTKELFEFWFQNIFIPGVKDKRNKKCDSILLLLDCTSSHWSKKYLNSINRCVTVDYFPPNLMINVQPSTQGIFKTLKNCYRRLYLQEMKRKFQEGVTMAKFLRTWNIIDCYRTISSAWTQVSRLKLMKAWSKILDFAAVIKEENIVTDITILLNQLLGSPVVSEEDITQWLDEDATLPSCRYFTDEEIMKECLDYQTFCKTLDNTNNGDNDNPEENENGVNGSEFENNETNTETMESKIENEEMDIDVDDQKLSVQQSNILTNDAIKDECVPTADEAIQGLKNFQRWCLTRKEFDENDHYIIQKLYNTAVKIEAHEKNNK